MVKNCQNNGTMYVTKDPKRSKLEREAVRYRGLMTTQARWRGGNGTAVFPVGKEFSLRERDAFVWG